MCDKEKGKDRIPPKLHPQLEGKRLLYIDSSPSEEIEQRSDLEKMELFYCVDIKFGNDSLLSVLQSGKFDILAIHPEVSEVWIKAIDDVCAAGIPVVIIKGDINAKPGIRETYNYFAKKGLSMVETELKHVRDAYENVLMDALVAALAK